jgi:diguanylate cyclase (GGDEF)-like protein
VKQKDLARFIAGQKYAGLPKFTVRTVINKPDRHSKHLKRKLTYNPIIFIEPMSPTSKNLIGLDIDSEPILRDALNQSAQSQSSVSSVPFNLLEGPLGYVLFRPVLNRPSGKQAFALLVVNAEAIQNEMTPLMENLNFRIYHASYTSEDPEGLLLHVEAPTPDKWEVKLLPRLSAERTLKSRSQPLVLKIDKQVGWSDLNLPLMITTGCTSLLSLGLLLLFLSSHYRLEAQRKKSVESLLHMATHDALTGLPNRILLEDRFSLIYSRAQRRNSPFSTLFLDLNKFKVVNDTYGHEVGDELLKAMGSLLKECIREEDTLCRLSGDEFVILLENTPYENAEKIAQKIKKCMAQPMRIQGIKLKIGVSVGIAVYPDDGTTINELLKIADDRMYQAKGQDKIGMPKQAHEVVP